MIKPRSCLPVVPFCPGQRRFQNIILSASKLGKSWANLHEFIMLLPVLPVCLGHITSSFCDFFLPCHLLFPLSSCFQFSCLITSLRHHPLTPSGLRVAEWRASLDSLVTAEDLATKLLWDSSKPLPAPMRPEKWGRVREQCLCLWYLSLGHHSRCQGSGETDC